MRGGGGMNTQKTLPVIDILRHRVGTDGHGMRTLIIVAGCPLRCQYCINPDTWDGTETAKEYSLEELYDEIKIDDLYFRATNGGITFGGGEPALYSEFIAEFIKMYCKNWNVCIETSLYVSWQNIKKLLGSVDNYFIDIKMFCAKDYKAYTGGELFLVIDNLTKLLQNISTDKIIVRLPIIQGYTDMEKCNNTKEALSNLGVKNIDIFEYQIWK